MSALSPACRRELEGVRGQGGIRSIDIGRRGERLDAHNSPGLFNVTADLFDFTGLKAADLFARLRRDGRFHFEVEHAFWRPSNAAELRWYYAHTASYLFANAVHNDGQAHIIQKEDAPVLDFSGGVGNIVLSLASRGIESVYTGIGLQEFQFARHRVRKRNLQSLVRFVEPYNDEWQLDPLAALLPPRTYGCILAFEVLEHIPHYERTVAAMVRALRPGGRICESAPFAPPLPVSDQEDARVHLSNGGIRMATAMGPSMRREGRCWRKGLPP